MSKIRITPDIDDVLYLSSKGFWSVGNREWGVTDPYNDDWIKWLSPDPVVCRARRNTIWTEGHTLGFSIMPHAHEVLGRLVTHGLYGHEVEIVAATSRPDIARDATEEAIGRDFGGIITDIAYAGFFDGPYDPAAMNLDKGSFFKALGSHGAIDDIPRHVEGAELNGIPEVIHFTAVHPPVKGLHKRIRQANCWLAVERILTSSQAIPQLLGGVNGS